LYISTFLFNIDCDNCIISTFVEIMMMIVVISVMRINISIFLLDTFCIVYRSCIFLGEMMKSVYLLNVMTYVYYVSFVRINHLYFFVCIDSFRSHLLVDRSLLLAELIVEKPNYIPLYGCVLYHSFISFVLSNSYILSIKSCSRADCVYY
jgi:hypothetical protein